MKPLRRISWLALGATLFLSLNLIGPFVTPFIGGTSGRVLAATADISEIKPRKHLSLKAYKVNSTPAPTVTKSLGSQPTQLAQTVILEQSGRLERGDTRLQQDGSYYDVYSFEGRQGQSVTIRLESRDFDTYLILVDPDEKPIGENDDAADRDSNSTLTVTLPKNGTYQVVVNSYEGGGEGAYALRVSGGQTTATTQSKPIPNSGGNSGSNSGGSSSAVSLDEQQRVLADGDRLYLQGDRSGAERLYRQVKPPFSNERSLQNQPTAITDPSQLSPESQVYWRNAQEGIAAGRDTQTQEALNLLIQASPQFVPAQELAAQNLIQQGKTKEAIALLEEATTRFPSSPELARLRVEALSEENQPLEASIAARQFAIVNPDHPDAAEFTKLADDNLKEFRGNLRERIAFRGLGGLAIGILTGRTQSTIFQGVQLAQLMIAGESGLGKQVAEQVKKEEKIITDPEVVAYIDKLGQNIAKYMGRDEFEYEFNVIDDEGINAFALPGGKVFVNTGAILAANSEAELAGLLAHEISHAVLSHGFERIMTNNLLANLSREIPLGDILGTLVSLSYSRDKERQADLIGARVLNSTGYAADGLRNFMVTLSQEGGSRAPAILSSHPAPPDRIRYLEELIIKNGYNRYSFEGVESLAQIQAQL